MELGKACSKGRDVAGPEPEVLIPVNKRATNEIPDWNVPLTTSVVGDWRLGASGREAERR